MEALLKIPFEEKDDAKAAAREAGGRLVWKEGPLWTFHGAELPASLRAYEVMEGGATDPLPESWRAPEVQQCVRFGDLELTLVHEGYAASDGEIRIAAVSETRWSLRLLVPGLDTEDPAGEVTYRQPEVELLRETLRGSLLLMEEESAAPTPLDLPSANALLVPSMPEGTGGFFDLLLPAGTTEKTDAADRPIRPVRMVASQIRLMITIFDRLLEHGNLV